VLEYDDALLAECGATIDDSEGLVNLPLGADGVQASILFKKQNGHTYRVSLRSKDDVDVRAIAELWNGGGHKNASGCTMTGALDDLKRDLVAAVGRALGAIA
jgi:phosphoesterase RecJ-like protein